MESPWNVLTARHPQTDGQSESVEWVPEHILRPSGLPLPHTGHVDSPEPCIFADHLH